MKMFLKVVLLVLAAVIAIKLLPLVFGLGCLIAGLLLGGVCWAGLGWPAFGVTGAVPGPPGA